MDEFLILLQAKLDEAKSKANVKADISKLQNELDKLKIQVELDPKSLSNIVKQLESALGQKIKMPNIAVDAKVGQQIGTNIGQNVVNGISKSSGKVNAEVQKLANQINKIQLLSNGGIKNDYSTQIAKLEGNFRSLGMTEDDIQKKTANVTKAFDSLRTKVNQPFDENNYQEIISLNDKLQKELAESNNEYTKLQSSAKGFVSIQQRLAKANTIEAWNQKNSAATKEVLSANQAYIDSLRDINSQMSKTKFNEIADGFKRSENSMRGINKLGASLKNQFSQAAQSFTQWLSVSSGIMLLISKTREAITEIKELDNILTEISKTSDMSSQQLKQLGMDAYDAASKYGRTASDYLLGVQEMARSGFYGDKGTAMAEQSLLAQSAGDMNAELANNYILATNAAYKLNGEADKLNGILDGQNSINKMVALYRNI